MLVIDFPQNDPDGYAACEAAIDAAIAARQATGKPMMVASSLPELLPATARDKLIAAGVPAMQGIDEAVAGFAAAARFGARRRQLAAADGALDLALPPAAAVASGREVVGEWESKRALAAFGLAVPEARLARPADALAAATALGFPVALKLARPILAHKTEAGAVKLGLANEAELATAIAEMRDSLARTQAAVAPEQFLIERMAAKPVAELIVGVTRDPQFGLALVIGAGGVLVEMAQDAATLLLPTDRAAVERALRGLKIARIVAGYRGGPAGDMDAAIDAVMAVAAFAEAERHRLVELDVNPLFVLPRGQGAVAVDALIVRATG
jgi:acyl-CoA synthetase (NDP forming)